MKCRWGWGAALTGRHMRAQFTICAKRPAASGDGPPRKEPESQAWTPAGAANALRLALRLLTHGEPDARAFRRLLQAAVGLKAKCEPERAAMQA
jgi:hypothetical protein